MPPLIPIEPLEPLADELWAITKKNWKGYDKWSNGDKDLLLGDARVRQLGEQADRIGGFEAMAAVVEMALYSRMHSGNQQIASAGVTEINHAWDGIGTWQA